MLDNLTATVHVRVSKRTKAAFQAYVTLQDRTISEELSAYMERKAVRPLLAAAEVSDDEPK